MQLRIKNLKANVNLSDQQLNKFELLLIVAFCTIPLFIQLPFKINLFLAYEGAHRIALGQIPYRDFYLPMGFGFWILPAICFKLFGSSLYSLLIAQAFINFIGALSFRSIIIKLGCSEAITFLSILVYCISFMFVNFWPWYNNSVFIFELVAIHFLLCHIFQKSNRLKITYLALTCFFLVLSFFTKQDGGGLAIITVSTMMLYQTTTVKELKWLLLYIAFAIFFLCLFIIPFISDDILYWFNYGQAPHNTRIGGEDIFIDVFQNSEWIKFYLLGVIVLFLYKISEQKTSNLPIKEGLFFILTIGILFQAIIVQVTSYIPHNVNIYFHSIAFSFFAYQLIGFNINKLTTLIVICIAILFWWSADYSRYAIRIIERNSPETFKDQKSFDQVSKYTWFVADSSTLKNTMVWKTSKYKSFKNILLPEETIQGIDSLMSLEIINKQGLKVLNMSELTPLSYEIGFEPPINQPLWFHKNVSIFDKEIKDLCVNIEEKEYDIVLFEVIPNLNQFYPDKIRECLIENYTLRLKFQAPRDNEKSFIEVYLR